VAVKNNDSALVLLQLSPTVTRHPDFRDSIEAFAASLPPGPIDTLREVGANKQRWKDVDWTSIAYEMHTSAGWALFALVGVAPITLNWTTGALQVQPIAFLILSFAFVRTGFGPWMLSVAFPVGAIVTLHKVSQMRAQALQGASDESAQNIEAAPVVSPRAPE
jgi:hypothetical protein